MDEKHETVPFLPAQDTRPSSQASSKSSKTTWLILSIGTLLNFALFLGTILIYIQHNTPGPLQSDIQEARQAVEYETRTFTGALKYDGESGNMYREQDYSTEFFGPPSEKLDEAWEELLHSKIDLFSPRMRR